MLSADESTGGVLITMNPSSTQFSGSATSVPVTITANAHGVCGVSTLNVTLSTEAAWSAGNARYNNNVPLPTGMGTRAIFDPPDGGNLYACTDCHTNHGDAGAGFGFNDVAHTPEQTGGYTDEQLLNIVQNGIVPDGGYFDTTITSYEMWQHFHHWNLTPEEQVGIVTYLRSLTPEAQNGTSNFGGFMGGHPPPDGGYHFGGDGGFHHHEGDAGGGGTGTGAGSTGAASTGAASTGASSGG
jgi:hypothetical protein